MVIKPSVFYTFLFNMCYVVRILLSKDCGPLKLITTQSTVTRKPCTGDQIIQNPDYITLEIDYIQTTCSNLGTEKSCSNKVLHVQNANQSARQK